MWRWRARYGRPGAKAAGAKKSKIPAERLELYEKLIAKAPDGLLRNTKELQKYLEIGRAYVKTLKLKRRRALSFLGAAE